MIQGIVLGMIQGITEWLPVSSEGAIVLARMHLFGASGLEDMIHFALTLHLGTFLAALIYFRSEVVTLLGSTLHYSRASSEQRAMVQFLFVSTLISGLVGVILLKTLIQFEDSLLSSAKIITLLIGVLLMITGGIQFVRTSTSCKSPKDATLVDGILLGVVQGFSVLPGLSRSGLTVAALLLRKFDDTHALTLSFLMSLPVVLGANIVLNLRDPHLNASTLLGCLFAFLFGFLTIHLLLKLSRRLNFAYFVLLFGVLMIVSGIG